MLVETQDEFEKFLCEAGNSNVLAIDTEFLRDKTYLPKLCLLQLAIKDKYILVDPFFVDITPLKSLLQDNNIVKVFHSPRQDIEVLYNYTGAIPLNVFDTQIAASFLGHSIQISYGNLVSAELSIKLDKADTYSDWSARPLIKSQLEYAKYDVVYLIDLYFKMTDKLNSLNRLDWVSQDVQQKYLDESLYIIDKNNRYKHLKRISSLSGFQLCCAKEIATWREEMAYQRNIPRRWVLSDERVIEISKRQPKDISAFFHMRGTKSKISTGDARQICDCVKRGCSYTDEQIKAITDNLNGISFDKSCHGDVDALVDVMNAFVKVRARQINIAPQILVSSSELSKIAHSVYQNVDVLKGWRKEIIGDDLIKLVNGDIQIKINKGKIVFDSYKEQS